MKVGFINLLRGDTMNIKVPYMKSLPVFLITVFGGGTVHAHWTGFTSIHDHPDYQPITPELLDGDPGNPGNPGIPVDCSMCIPAHDMLALISLLEDKDVSIIKYTSPFKGVDIKDKSLLEGWSSVQSYSETIPLLREKNKNNLLIDKNIELVDFLEGNVTETLHISGNSQKVSQVMGGLKSLGVQTNGLDLRAYNLPVKFNKTIASLDNFTSNKIKDSFMGSKEMVKIKSNNSLLNGITFHHTIFYKEGIPEDIIKNVLQSDGIEHLRSLANGSAVLK